jgi:hypothetical protein
MRPLTQPRSLRACATCALAATGLAAGVPAADSAGADGQRLTFASPLAARLAPAGSVLALALFHRPKHTPRRIDRTAAEIRAMIAAGNRIATLPYVYGGGHGSFDASGYDCSGSVSYVLHAAGLLSTPLDSVGLESFGAPGPGKHVTIYANDTHAWMTLDGRRFDTIALQETGTRWSSTISSADGYIVRHPVGL